MSNPYLGIVKMSCGCNELDDMYMCLVKCASLQNGAGWPVILAFIYALMDRGFRWYSWHVTGVNDLRVIHYDWLPERLKHLYPRGTIVIYTLGSGGRTCYAITEQQKTKEDEDTESLYKIVAMPEDECSLLDEINPNLVTDRVVDNLDSIPPCKAVRFSCVKRPGTIPMMGVIESNVDLGLCKVAYARPNPCVLVPSTNVSIADRVEVEEEVVDGNVILTFKYPSGSRRVLVYPVKVWDEIKRRFIEPLSRGDPPLEMGAILAGPPGTGKTSMAEALSEMLGLPLIMLAPEQILSKWVGESEKNLAAKLNEAEQLEPSLILIDEGDWITGRREDIHQTDVVRPTISGILLERISSWQKRGVRVLTIVTTNVSPEKLDPAFRRSGRLGRPIFIPLPDLVAIREYMVRMGVPPRDADNLARRLVSIGAEMSLVERVTKEYLAGNRNFKLEPQRERGYVRGMLPLSITSEDMLIVKRILERSGTHENPKMLCRILSAPTSRVHIIAPSEVAIPVVIGLASECGISTVILRADEYIEEAMSTAEVSKATLVIPTEIIKRTEKIVAPQINIPIVFTGLQDVVTIHNNPISKYKIMITPDTIEQKASLVSLVLKYYNPNYKVDRRELEKAIADIQPAKLVNCVLPNLIAAGTEADIRHIYTRYCE